MEVSNNGERITITATYWEAAAITEAIRKSITAYELEGATEFADNARQLVDELTNDVQIIK